MARLVVWWHKKHMVKEPSFDFRTAREIYLRRLHTVIQLEKHYLIQPEIELEGYEDEKWEWFQNCLGALDGTCVNVHVLLKDQGRYRNTKNDIATNVLGACSRDMKFPYILPGWEESVADSKVLCDALVRQDPLIVPNGKYFLVDTGYTNGPNFLAPYRGVRYHINEWLAQAKGLGIHCLEFYLEAISRNDDQQGDPLSVFDIGPFTEFITQEGTSIDDFQTNCDVVERPRDQLPAEIFSSYNGSEIIANESYDFLLYGTSIDNNSLNSDDKAEGEASKPEEPMSYEEALTSEFTNIKSLNSATIDVSISCKQDATANDEGLYAAIQAEITDKFFYNLSKKKAWMGKKKAIVELFSDWVKSYKLLPRFLDVVKQNNPGTVVHWDKEPMHGNPLQEISANGIKASGHEVVLSKFWFFLFSCNGYMPTLQLGLQTFGSKLVFTLYIWNDLGITFSPEPNKVHWPPEGELMLVPNNSMRRNTKGRPKSTLLHNEMYAKECQTKLTCSLCKQKGHNKRRSPTRQQ
ncbi:hypothetical protein ACH5RR_036776 [Cinchona calisaya]|uniref:DDE Tnp4 domain-containing protein n=1 Tax=Cinchona calisaya TaxID=153742 RepID=A0ABD2Y7B9_9GENT